MKPANFLLVFIMGLVATAALAGPANIEPVVVDQPDGTSIQVMMRGDEFQGWMETSDGYTIVKRPQTGYFEFAVQDAAGNLIPSGFVVSQASRSILASSGLMPEKGIRPPRNTELEDYKKQQIGAVYSGRAKSAVQIMTAPTGTWAPVPVSGPKKILVVLVNFQNVSLSSGSAAYWSDAVFGATSASVARYYQDNSFGAVAITPVSHTQGGNPTGVVTVNLAQSHPNCGGSCSYSTESQWINAALAAAAPYVNFPALDANGDGTISVDEALIYFVLAGYETAAGSGLTPTIWAHAWGGAGVGVSGKVVNHWALNGERYSSSQQMKMGVIAHETGHAMGGLPDLYDISGTNGGLGVFSVMAGGSWGRRSGEIGGATPVGMDAWSRQYLGWSTPQLPSNGATGSLVSGLANPSASFLLMNDALSTSEYWLVENRPPTSWDAGMYVSLGTWSGGLLIQHIDLNVGTKSANDFNQYVTGRHQGNMAVEPSTAACSLRNSTSRGCATILYYSGNSATFNNASTPNSSYYSGTASSVGVTGISAPGSTMSATFNTASSYPLNLSKSGGGSGTVSSAPAGINCGASCSANFGSGTSVTLTATAASGSSFAGWSGDCSGTGTCVISMTQARNVTANFSIGGLLGGSYTMTVARAGAGGGTVTSTPAGIACGGTCSASFSSGSTVVLTAVAASGSTFSGWSGACTGTGTCVTTMTAARSVTATFDLSAVSSYTLSVSKAGAGNGTVSSSPTGISCGSTCSASYSAGTSVTLTALADTGSTFVGWSGACTGTGTCVTSMTAARSVTATFGSAGGSSYALSVTRAGAGSGTIASSPGGINCGSACSASFSAGTSVALTPIAPAGSTFAGWSGDCSGTGSCVVSMTQARNVTAFFDSALLATSYTLSAAKAGAGSGTVTSTPAGINCGSTCGASFSWGTTVSLTAVAASGSTFTGWSGACSGTGACVTSMAGSRSVIATFDAAGTPSYTLSVAKAGAGTGSVTSTPAGIGCGNTCSANYSSGTSVTLTAAADSGSTFTGWSGACNGTGTCVVGMAAARSVTATFDTVTPNYALTVSKAGAGSGTVTSNPAGISCGSTCSANFSWNTTVTLTAIADSGWTFTGWSGGCTGTGTCVISMTGARSVTATFDSAPGANYLLSVGKAGAGSGSVTSSPAGINCGSTCSASYASGTSVTLTAVAAAGSTFAGWSGACVGTGPCVTSMTAARSATALFDSSFLATSYTLFVSKGGAGAGTVTSSPAGINCGATCSASFASGATVTLTAVAASGSTFTGWSGACTGTGACVTSMSGSRSVMANFDLSSGTSYTLSVSKSGAGSGTVSSTPAGIDCGVTCSASYASGTSVTLTVAAAAGSNFTGWSGACAGTGSCVVSMTAARSVTANFDLAAINYTLSVSKTGAGGGTVTSAPAGISCGVTCSASYASGTSVTLTAVAAIGSTFTGWSGACAGTGSCVVGMTQARSVTANFDSSGLLGFGYTLSVTRAGAGSGIVTSSPAGINCGSTCSASFSSGSSITLSAAASSGSTFAGWSGACSGTGACVVNMTTARAVTASFSSSGVTLGEAVDNAALSWTSSGNASWAGQTLVTLDGVDAAQSGLITDGQGSILQTTVVGPGVLTYFWKVSSEYGWDWLTFYFDGYAQAGAISGEVAWTQQAWSIPAGVHVLQWRYEKDYSLSSGSDRAWLDQVTFSGGLLAPGAPAPVLLQSKPATSAPKGQ